MIEILRRDRTPGPRRAALCRAIRRSARGLDPLAQGQLADHDSLWGGTLFGGAFEREEECPFEPYTPEAREWQIRQGEV